MGVKSKKTFLIFCTISITLLIATYLLESFYSKYVNENWNSISQEEKGKQEKYIQDQFLDYQQTILNKIKELSDQSSIVSSLEGNLPIDSLFNYLSKQKYNDVSIEVFNKKKQSIAWINDYRTIVNPSLLSDSSLIAIIPKPLFTYLVITIPIVYNNQIVGYIAGKRLFEVNLPLSNRFINENTFTNTFTAKLNIRPEYRFSPGQDISENGNYQSIPLLGFNGFHLGIAIVPLPIKEDHTDFLLGPIKLARGLIGFIIFIGILIWLIDKIDRYRLAVKIILISGSIWVFRYFLIWSTVPEQLFSDLFGPGYFASPYGYGIARSLGDILLTSLFLLANAFFVFRFYQISAKSDSAESGKINHRIKTQIIISVSILSIIFYLSFRAGSAIFKSAIRDSSLSFNDLSTILPSIELTILLFALSMIILSIILLDIVIIRSIKNQIRTFRYKNSSELNEWLITLVVVITGGIIFGLSQKTPLISYEIRTILIIGIVLLTYLIENWLDKDYGNKYFRIGISVLIITILWILPSLRFELENRERGKVENLSKNILRPIDAWLSYLVQQTIDECTDEQTVKIISEGGRSENSSLAFKKWSGSLLSSEGNNCSISFYDNSGKAFSNFQIGGFSASDELLPVSDSLARYPLTQIEKSLNGTTMHWLVGSSLIRDQRGNQIGTVRVAITGNKLTFLRGEVPEILRSTTMQSQAGLEQPLILSEYFRDTMISSTNEAFFVQRAIGRSISESLEQKNNLWLEEDVEGKKYESLYFRDDNDKVSASIYGLSRLKPGFFLSLFWFIRIVSVFILTAIAIIIFYTLQRRLKNQRKKFNFTEKLLVSYLLVATFPVIYFGYYNKQTAAVRAEDDLQAQLQNQTEIVVSELKRRYELNTPVTISGVYDTQCSDLAEDINTDFDIYNSVELSATSKPELYDAELIDSHLDATAYQALFLKGKLFYSQKKQLGNLTYVVGYRPLRSESGRVIGAVSVPTLLKQSERDKEMVQSNAVLFSIYGLGFALSLLLGYILSRQFGAPIKNLMNATREISHGNLLYKRTILRNDELGELDRAFEQMAHDLKNKQEQLLTAQREAAWREMAKQVAHEIKNPLTPMKLSLQHLRIASHDRVKNFEELMEKVISTTLEQIDALSKIASEFSQMAKMPERNFEEIDMHAILKEAGNLFGNYDKIKITLNLLASKKMVKADRDEIRRACVNIIKNSVQALREDGRIDIETENRNDDLIIRIQDSGPGMNKETLDRLFEINFSTKSEGMGIGLAMVKRTINDFNGTIEITSTVGNGALVTITLPVIGI
jgi:two-component system, NtrC family, nitrogen regulation sensor histidine kinase NtrY